jgi:hypothetical protein
MENSEQRSLTSDSTFANAIRALCLLAILLASCREDDDVNFITSYGYFKTQLNGELWRHNVYEGIKYIYGYSYRPWPCNEAHGVELGLRTFSGDIKWRTSQYDLITFWQIPLVPGTYQLHTMAVHECLPDSVVQVKFRVMTREGFVASYDIIDGASNYLNVESYDPETKIITASFELHMAREDSIANEWYPDTVRFSGGKFRTKFLN